MRRILLVVVIVQSLCLAPSALAAMDFYTSESAWLLATANLEEFDTTSGNIALANEVGPPPNGNADLGSILTFEASNIGLSRGFSLRSLSIPTYMERGLVYDDSEAGLGGPRNISIGDADGTGDPLTRSMYENDDWRLDILTGPNLTAFGFTIIGNNESIAESMQIYSGLNLLGTVTDLANSDGSNTRFLGVVTTQPITRIVFDEDEVDPGPDYDDIAIRDFRFGENEAIVSVESTTWVGIKALYQ